MCILVIVLTSVLCLSQASDVVKVSLVDLKQSPAVVPDSRIIGGYPANIDRYPFTVQVNINNRLVCGGSLLTSRHVLSAAHCFYDDRNFLVPASQLSVRVGSAKLNTGGKTHRVSILVLHQAYDLTTHDSDVALLVLSSNVKLNNNVRTASIPTRGSTLRDDTTIVHTGWGVTSVGSNQLSSVLLEVTVRKVNWSECKRRYDELRNATGYAFYVTNKMICAGLLNDGGADACQGDSGGPLIYSGNIVVGITSWGYQCAHPLYPGVNARVADFSDWINSTIARYNTGAPLGSTNIVVMISSLLVSLIIFKEV